MKTWNKENNKEMRIKQWWRNMNRSLKEEDSEIIPQ